MLRAGLFVELIVGSLGKLGIVVAIGHGEVEPAVVGIVDFDVELGSYVS